MLKNSLGLSQFAAFNADSVEKIAPDEPGVIVFYDDDGIVLRIEAVERSISKRLKDHYVGYEGRLTQGSDYIGFEPCHNPEVRADELDSMYFRIYGRRPIFNEIA